MHRLKKITWEALDWKGLEQCTINTLPSGYIVTSKVEGEIDSQPFNVEYTIEINLQWEVTFVKIVSLPDDQTLLELYKKRQQWIDQHNKKLQRFSSCKDIDIAITPFTNTLPIRRLTFAPQQKHAITVIYIDFPFGSIKPMKQWYTQLTERTYKYEDETGYTNTITVDEQGFVVDYPHLFKQKK